MMDNDEIYECGVVSDCCNAEIKFGDICCDCGEHCEPVDLGEDYQDDDDSWSAGFADNH